MDSETRRGLIEAYVGRIIDSMDTDDLVSTVFDYMTEALESYTDQDLMEEVQETFPDLAESFLEN